MVITCNTCKNKLSFNPELIFKQGPVYTYLKCPFCSKISAIKKELIPVTDRHRGAGDRAAAGAGFAGPGNNQGVADSTPDPQNVPRNNVNKSRMDDAGPAPGIAFTITHAIRQQLYDLGYSQQEVFDMPPEIAHEIVRFQITKPAKAGNEAKALKAQVPGWLIVHDETARVQSFDLKEGKNVIGRKSSMAVDIAIETEDLTMGRRHCMVEVKVNEKRGGFDFLISDLKSVNGTILNGRIQRKLTDQDVIYLNDGDTFQLGLTKVVFKRNSELKIKETVVKEVVNQPYQPTVIITQDKVEQIFKKR
jgi:pSer/pThr/pTyr-binding forkhead associated (FHA) protein